MFQHFLWISFPLLNQLDRSNKEQRIKLKELMEINPSKYYLDDDRTANKCTQCEYNSSNTDNLKTHLITHNEEK